MDENDYEIQSAQLKVLGVGSFGRKVVSVLKKNGIKGAELLYIQNNTKNVRKLVRSIDMIILVGDSASAKDMLNVLRSCNRNAIKLCYFEGSEDKLREVVKNSDSVVMLNENYSKQSVAHMIKNAIETIAVPSLVGLDYADFKAILESGCYGVMCSGRGKGINMVNDAVRNAFLRLSAKLDLDKVKGAIIHTQGGADMTLDDINRVGELVTENVSPEANVIWGADVDEKLKKEMCVNVMFFYGMKRGKRVKSIKLKVTESISDDVGKNLARMDRSNMRKLGVEPGDLIMIKGERETVANVDSAYPGDIGLNILRINGMTRRNAKIGISEDVRVGRINIEDAKKVVIAPAKSGLIIRTSPEILKGGLIGKAFIKGDIVEISCGLKYKGGPFFEDIFKILDDHMRCLGFNGLKFLVSSTVPKGAVIVTEKTKMVYKEKPEAYESRAREFITNSMKKYEERMKGAKTVKELNKLKKDVNRIKVVVLKSIISEMEKQKRKVVSRINKKIGGLRRKNEQHNNNKTKNKKNRA